MRPTSPPNLLDRRKAAAYLDSTYTTLSAWASKGSVDLPYIKIGGRVKYRQEDLDAFLERQTVSKASNAGQATQEDGRAES